MPPANARVRVRYAETDKMGVVYYANYFVWFEVGRCEVLRAAGSSYRSLEEDEGVQLPVIEAGCTYKQPGRYDDELDVRAEGTVVSPTRIRFDYAVRRVADDALLAEGFTVHAAINSVGRPCRVPEHLRTVLG